MHWNAIPWNTFYMREIWVWCSISPYCLSKSIQLTTYRFLRSNFMIMLRQYCSRPNLIIFESWYRLFSARWHLVNEHVWGTPPKILLSWKVSYGMCLNFPETSWSFHVPKEVCRVNHRHPSIPWVFSLSLSLRDPCEHRHPMIWQSLWHGHSCGARNVTSFIG